MNSMDIMDLRLLETVARCGSMNRAANELHTVQSNVSARVKAMEQELGVVLFQRHAKGVRISPAGQRMLPYAMRMSKLLLDAVSAARDSGEPSGTLEFGTLETTLALRLPDVIAEYAKAHPLVRPLVRTGTTASLVQDVVDGKLEGAFVAGPINRHELLCEPIFKEELVLIAPRSIDRVDTLADVADLKTVVFRVGCSYRQRLDNYLVGIGVVPSEPLEFGSIEAILACVSSGVGVSLLPRGLVADAWRLGRISAHELPADQAQVDTIFIRRSDAYESSALATFLSFVRCGGTAAIAAE